MDKVLKKQINVNNTYHSSQRACNSLWILNRLFAVSEVTWMFNEGVYLLKTIMFVFSQKSYMWAFFLFGWGKHIIFFKLLLLDFHIFHPQVSAHFIHVTFSLETKQPRSQRKVCTSHRRWHKLSPPPPHQKQAPIAKIP